jgi:SAM-dependent methyltransferase
MGPYCTVPHKHTAEVAHWNRIEEAARCGSRQFWLNHPRVWHHYYAKSLIDGMRWFQWVPKQFGRPASRALELGCGNGQYLAKLVAGGLASEFVGIDLDAGRFDSSLLTKFPQVQLMAADVNQLELEAESFELIYANQAFHHFENLEHIMREVHKALKPGGFFVLDEYVGPARFQWTEPQLGLTSQMLGLIPRHLRMYANGMEKAAAGRSTVEEVIAVCPSEAIRSDEIVPLLYQHFQVVHDKKLGGTIQHLLYSGIVHNFPDHHPPTNHMIDCINGLEGVFIDYAILASDFALLVAVKN